MSEHTGALSAQGAVGPVGLQQIAPAGFWIRFVASFIDGCVVAVLSFGPQILGVIAAVGGGVLGAEDEGGAALIVQLLLTLVSWAFVFVYYAWFYRNKGGTPGKLLFNLRVVDAESGEYIEWGRTFLREFVGKGILNTVTLWIGYIMAGFRSDKRGLHDLVGGTRVIKLLS